MILGIGFDLTDAARLARVAREHGPQFIKRVFTEAEQRESADAVDPHHALAHRFAAKEACLKALGTGWQDGIAFTDVEIRRIGHEWRVELAGTAAARSAELAVRAVHVTTTEVDNDVAAFAILED